MDLKTIITIAPLVRRLYRRMPRSLRIVAVLVAVVVAVKRLFRGRAEEPESTGEAAAQAEGQTTAGG